MPISLSSSLISVLSRAKRRVKPLEVNRVANLPPELLVHVVEFLADDRDSLRNTSLVHSAFREPSQRVLFSVLELKPPPWSNRANYAPGSTLLELFDSNPAIAGYPTDISIQGDYAGSRATWLTKDPMILEALNRLSFNKIRRFSFQGGHLPDLWTRLPPTIQAVIIKICNSSSLTSLSLSKAPISLLNTTRSSLRELALERSTNIDLDIPLSLEAPKSPTTVERLYVKDHAGFPAAVNWILDEKNGISLHCLKYLQMEVPCINESEWILTLLEACCSSLETFAFGRPTTIAVGSGDEEVNANNVNLALLPKLRRLGVQCYAAEDPGSVDPEEENFLDPLPSLITILNTIPRSNTIEDFHLTMDYGVEDTTRLDVDSWADVDEFLTNKARLPHLKSVRIEVNNFFDYFVDEIADEVRRSIPKLEASGMLTLRAQTRNWGIFAPFSS